MKRSSPRDRKPSLELIEEAFVLLRSCPSDILATYYLGAVPFAAGLLFFCNFFSGNPNAGDRLSAFSLGISILFLWMKFFQARFGAKLQARLRGGETAPWNIREAMKSFSVQATIHSTGFFLLPLASLLLLPVGWVYAFYQNASALDDGKTGVRELCRLSWRQAALWPAQNHSILSILFVFFLFVFSNWLSVLVMIPQLLKMFFGIESVFTQSPESMLNTTVLAAAACLTYLSADPLIKACYVLRSFYGNSLRTGNDLKVEIQRSAGRVPALVIVIAFLFLPPFLSAQEPSPSPAPIASKQLDEAISTILGKDKYTWRKPKAEDESDEIKKNPILEFFESISNLLQEMKHSINKFFHDLMKWLFPDKKHPPMAEGSSWLGSQKILLAILAVGIAGLAGFALWHALRKRRQVATVEGIALQPEPNIEDENTSAQDLPEDDWTKMGRSFLEKGELRLSLRAFYLSGLANLASRGLITLARAKSNRDYEREVGRRAHAMPDLPGLFDENSRIFDRTWYGQHEVSIELIERFVANLEKIKASA